MSGSFTQGQAAGTEAVTISQSTLPAHTHALTGNNAVVGAANNSTAATPTGNFFANQGKNVFATGQPNAAMSPGTVSNVGGSQPHNNMSPFLVLNFCIALVGAFPSRN
jgi:microcystin-dependent protein